MVGRERRTVTAWPDAGFSLMTLAFIAVLKMSDNTEVVCQIVFGARCSLVIAATNSSMSIHVIEPIWRWSNTGRM